MDTVVSDLSDISLEKLKEYELRFSELENSTFTVEAKIHDIKFEEKDLINKLECTDTIIALDCNYGHKRHSSYPAPKEKSTRGRKPKPKIKKDRKVQGDGSSFNSQIQITIRITKDEFPDSKVLTEPYNLYYVKLFRSGKIGIPGILLSNMSDAELVLQKLGEYLFPKYFPESKIDPPKTIMRDYKFKILPQEQYDEDGNEIHVEEINLYRVRDVWLLEKNNLINVSAEAIISYYLDCSTGIFDISSLIDYVKNEFPGIKNIWTRPDKLQEFINHSNIGVCMEKVKKFITVAGAKNIELRPDMIFNLKKYTIIDSVNEIVGKMRKDSDNLTNSVQYDNDAYQGLIITLNTPNPIKPDKKTKLKLFSSGKINIDGANSFDEAVYIYRWLNYMFFTNWSKFIRNPNDPKFLAKDPEYSSDDSIFDLGY